jgi:hypothetical protein
MDASALVYLDMGEYEVPGINVAVTLGGEAAQPAPSKGGAGAPQQLRGGHGHGVLRVYSVAPGCLAERAKEWGGSLAFREGWHQTDRGFFDAPGAVVAAGRKPRDQALAADAMPPVTIVFATVEGAKWLLRWRHGAEARQMARLLHLVMSAALRAVPSGYMCSEQDGGLRHMLAFRSAEGALLWCLLVQEALMYAPWPPALLCMPGFFEQHAADGTLLFRGPCIKMGVAEGRPRGLVADEEGRADYFGPCVKKAARYADGVAQGGQVVCELQLAKGVMRCAVLSFAWLFPSIGWALWALWVPGNARRVHWPEQRQGAARRALGRLRANVLSQPKLQTVRLPTCTAPPLCLYAPLQQLAHDGPAFSCWRAALGI